MLDFVFFFSHICVCTCVCVHVNRRSVHMICFHWGLEPSGDYSWTLRKKLWVLQTSLRGEGDKTSQYRQEFSRIQKLYQYANRNLKTTAAISFPEAKHIFSLLFPLHNTRSCEFAHAWCYNRGMEVIFQVTLTPMRCPSHLKAVVL